MKAGLPCTAIRSARVTTGTSTEASHRSGWASAHASETVECSVVPPNAERRRASFGTDCFRLDSDPRKVPANLLRERRIRFDCDNLSAELTESFRVVTSMSADIKDQRAATNERSEQAAEPQTFAEVATVKGTLVRVASWPVETSAHAHAAQPKTLRAGRQGSHTGRQTSATCASVVGNSCGDQERRAAESPLFGHRQRVGDQARRLVDVGVGALHHSEIRDADRRRRDRRLFDVRMEHVACDRRLVAHDLGPAGMPRAQVALRRRTN